MTPPETAPVTPSWLRRLTAGAALGALLWLAESVALSVGVLGIGGWGVLASLRQELAGWGLATLLVGALLGLLERPPLRGVGPVLGWLALLLVADEGVLPWAVHALLIGVAALLWIGVRRLPLRWAAGGTGALAAAMGLVLAPLPGWGQAPRGKASADLPDVVLIVLDTVRTDRLGFVGHPTANTPNIDRLAAEGTWFRRARSTSSWTLPSHASLFTGLSPSEHGAHAGHPRLEEGPETLAEVLDARGYRTVGLSANAWVSPGTGLHRGFEHFGFHGDEALANLGLVARVFHRPMDLGGRALTDAAVEAIEDAASADEPLFLFVNYLEAHEPLGMVPDPPIDPERGRRWLRDMPRFWCTCEGTHRIGDGPDALSCGDGKYRATPDRIVAVSEAYDAGVAYIDSLFGEVREALEDAGRWDDAVVVVTSDHGEHLGERGRLGHMVWLDDPLLDVPLVGKAPGLRAGHVDPRPFDGAEVMPWLLAQVDGAPAPPRRATALSEVHPHPASTARRWERLFGCDFTPATEARQVLLRPDATTSGVDDGRDWVRDAPGGPAHRPGVVQPSQRQTPVELDAATKRALEELGYVQ